MAVFEVELWPECLCPSKFTCGNLSPQGDGGAVVKGPLASAGDERARTQSPGQQESLEKAC